MYVLLKLYFNKVHEANSNINPRSSLLLQTIYALSIMYDIIIRMMLPSIYPKLKIKSKM